MYKCEDCKLEFKTFQAKANHYRWKHLKYAYKNPHNHENHTLNCKIAAEIRFGKIIEEDTKCFNCGNAIHIKYREGKRKQKYFCSRSCANKRKHTEETKNKIRTSLQKEIKHKFCDNCGKEIFGHRRFCSKECRHEYRIKDYTSYQRYKLACQFTFSLNEYPEKFDFLLVEKYGWYKAKNRGNNLNGVSRDHMFSIKEGFLQNIDPKIISHPANCQLMRHNDNISKYKKCSITLEELQKRINEWDNK